MKAKSVLIDYLTPIWPIPIITSLIATLIFIMSGSGNKWFLMALMACIVFFVSLLFTNFQSFSAWVLAACIPVAFQYRLISHGSKTSTISHFGGAIDEPVINLVDFPIFLIFVVWLVGFSLGYGKKIIWTNFDKALIVFFLCSTMSLINATEFKLFFYELFRYAKYIVLYLMLRSFEQNKSYLVGILVITVLALFPQALVSLAQYFLYFVLPIPVGGVTEPSYELINGKFILRVTGFVGHCNTFAHYLIVPLTACFVLILSRVAIHWKLLATSFFVAGSFALILTFSRSGWLGLILMMSLALATCLYFKRIKFSYLGLMAVLSLIVIGLLFVTGVLDAIIVRVFETNNSAYDSRWDLMSVAIGMIKEFPIFGVGLNSFEEHMSAYDENGVINVIHQPVHNIYLLLSAETGIVSLLLILLAFYFFINHCVALMKEGSELRFFLGIFGFCTALTLAFTNMFDLSLRKEPLMGCMALISALVMSEVTKAGDDHAEQ